MLRARRICRSLSCHQVLALESMCSAPFYRRTSNTNRYMEAKGKYNSTHGCPIDLLYRCSNQHDSGSHCTAATETHTMELHTLTVLQEAHLPSVSRPASALCPITLCSNATTTGASITAVLSWLQILVPSKGTPLIQPPHIYQLASGSMPRTGTFPRQQPTLTLPAMHASMI